VKRVLACALAASLAPSVAFALPALQSGSLPHGGTYYVAPDTQAPTAAIDLWFRAPADGYDGLTPGIARIAAAAAAATRLANGRTLAESVAQAGGNLSISVFPDLVSIGVIVPPPAAQRILASMTAAYFAPQVDAASLGAGEKDTVVQVVQQQYEADVLAQDALFGSLFVAGPASQPPVPFSTSDVTHIELGAVESFAQRAFRSSNAFLTLAGNVNDEMLSVVTDGTGAATPDLPIDSRPAPSARATTTQGEEPGIGIAWLGPPIADERAATALDFVADYLFNSSDGTVIGAMRRSDAQAYLHGQFITLHDPGVMLVTIQGSDDQSLEQLVLQAVADLQKPLEPATFDAAREAFLYHITAQTQTPGEEADMLGWYAAEGAASYAPGGEDYQRIARSLDPDFVAQTVRRYLLHPATVRVVVPASSQEGSST
jgi:predicted Zn-dependent peptidase